PPSGWHDVRVLAGHARPEENRARGNGVAFPSTEIMLERRIGIETEPVEQVEESERRALGEFVAERIRRQPRPEGLLVPDGLNRQIVRHRDRFREGVEVHGAPRQAPGSDEAHVLEILAELWRTGRGT